MQGLSLKVPIKAAVIIAGFKGSIQGSVQGSGEDK